MGFLAPILLLGSLFAPTPAIASEPAPPRPATISVSDLPAGWSVDAQASGTATSPCRVGVMPAAKSQKRASVAYEDGSSLPALQEVVAAGPRASARYSAITRGLARCKSVSVAIGHQSVRGRAHLIILPVFGNQSRAYAFTGSSNGVAVGTYLVVFQSGDVVGEIANEAVGTPSFNQFETYTTDAVEKLTAASNSPAKPTPFGQSQNVAGWNLRLLSLTPVPPGTPEGPPPGYDFEVYSIQATRTAATPASPSAALSVSLVGPSKMVRNSASTPTCHAGATNTSQILQGGTTAVNGCISVTVADGSDLLMSVNGAGSPTPVWFATR